MDALNQEAHKALCVEGPTNIMTGELPQITRFSALYTP